MIRSRETRRGSKLQTLYSKGTRFEQTLRRFIGSEALSFVVVIVVGVVVVVLVLVLARAMYRSLLFSFSPFVLTCAESAVTGFYRV